ncbi:MAG: pyridoxamine 5'-phosphate oxidase family protein [Bifidobacterium crudilactis]|jgi:predicted pyridoxine 5'-phosphate oxidase superfamily flavin-nucleotide-binding protein
MVALNDEMKDMIDNSVSYIATVDHEGNPDIGPKMSMHVIDDTHIGYYERTAGQHYRNLQDNGRLIVMVVNPKEKKGYRFHGEVTLHQNDDVHEAAIAYADEHDIKHPVAVPVMKITGIDNLAPGPGAGKPIA